jgi:hypothetical protein
VSIELGGEKAVQSHQFRRSCSITFSLVKRFLHFPGNQWP